MITVIPRLIRLEWQPKNCVKQNSRYASQFIAKKNCQKNLHNAEILYYKIVLCKFFWTSSKNHVIRAIGNRVNRGMTVYTILDFLNPPPPLMYIILPYSTLGFLDSKCAFFLARPL